MIPLASIAKVGSKLRGTRRQRLSFLELEKEAKKASEQIRSSKKSTGGKIILSKAEKAKWPFLQPSIKVLRTDLSEPKKTLMLNLQLTNLAFSKKMAEM